jgi:hypothetical protein
LAGLKSLVEKREVGMGGGTSMVYYLIERIASSLISHHRPSIRVVVVCVGRFVWGHISVLKMICIDSKAYLFGLMLYLGGSIKDTGRTLQLQNQYNSNIGIRAYLLFLIIKPLKCSWNRRWGSLHSNLVDHLFKTYKLIQYI